MSLNENQFTQLRLYAGLNPIAGMMTFDFERVVKSAVEKLSDYKVELIILIPLKSKTNLDAVFNNLVSLDLPLKTGVILGLDRRIDIDWQIALYDKIAYLRTSRFVFVEPVFTTALSRDSLSENWLVEESASKLDGMRKELADLGVKSVGKYPVIFAVVREELRLVVSGLQCDYVLWLDADELLPRDVISRLLRHLAPRRLSLAAQGESNLDVVAGWALDRHHVKLEKATFAPVENYEPETAQEVEWYKVMREYLQQINEIILFHAWRLSNFMLETTVQVENLIAPSKIRRETSLIEIETTGMGCVLVKKELNDAGTFVDPDPNIANSEDRTFCDSLRKCGYRLFVDPAVFCEHVQ